MCTVMVLGLTIAYGMVSGGQGRKISDEIAAAVGLSIEAIKMTGQAETGEFQILEALELDSNSSLLLLDAHAAMERISEIAWVESVSILKLYPNTLNIMVKEKNPFALWQRGDIVSIIDQNGKVITDSVEPRHAGLPLLIGHGAQFNSRDILGQIEEFPGISQRIRAYRYVSGRRWDLILANGLTIQLPESDVLEALREIDQLNSKNGVFSKDIVNIDMRLHDRIVFRLGKNALEGGEEQDAVRESRQQVEADT